MNWNVVAAWTLDRVFGFQSANKIRENLIVLASMRRVYPLGGSRAISLPLVASVQDAVDFLDVELNGDNLGNLTKVLRVECWTADAATTITPRLWNVTDAVSAVDGVACAALTPAGTNGTQVLVATIAAGVKKYRLQATPSDAVNPTFVVGYLEIYSDT